MDRALRAAVAAALGAPIRAATSLAGGDIHSAWRLDLGDRSVFLKSSPMAPPAMFPAEAHGLAWLAHAGALRIPAVLAVDPTFLALEFLPPGPGGPATDEALGRGLALLHRSLPAGTPPGLAHDNFIGRLPQSNASALDWPTFYRERRLLPMIAQARLPSELRHRLDRLCADLPALVGLAEPMARIHGDLWGGNWHPTSSGAPCLFDPACSAASRELDLAMMQLFGGFSPRVFSAYDELWPRLPGHADRVPLYQLYYLLVHVAHFGAGWVQPTSAALDALGYQ